jgi:hypothetical protein
VPCSINHLSEHSLAKLFQHVRNRTYLLSTSTRETSHLIQKYKTEPLNYLVQMFKCLWPAFLSLTALANRGTLGEWYKKNMTLADSHKAKN